MKLVGWITAQESDRVYLRDDLNVKGEMIYNEAMGCFECCTLDSMETVEKLRRDWPGFYAEAFTAIDSNGNQLPRDEQPCRGMSRESKRMGMKALLCPNCGSGKFKELAGKRKCIFCGAEFETGTDKDASPPHFRYTPEDNVKEDNIVIPGLGLCRIRHSRPGITAEDWEWSCFR